MIMIGCDQQSSLRVFFVLPKDRLNFSTHPMKSVSLVIQSQAPIQIAISKLPKTVSTRHYHEYAECRWQTCRFFNFSVVDALTSEQFMSNLTRDKDLLCPMATATPLSFS